MASSPEAEATKAKVMFVSHGGGPLPLLGDPDHAELIESLKEMVRELPEPKAVVVLSAHWEEKNQPAVLSSTGKLLYDYGGFPQESYEIRYPAPGDTLLAERIQKMLQNGGWKDAKLISGGDGRGLDHGVFVPLSMMLPRANIPVVQVSLLNPPTAAPHLTLGIALSPLLQEDVWVVGSGYTFHNMQAFFGKKTQESTRLNEGFEEWLSSTLLDPKMTIEDRLSALGKWETVAPGARYCHPREEHLMPVLACAALARRPATKVLAFKAFGLRSSHILW